MASSSDFVARIGVNIHLDAVTTAYGNVGLVASSLAYLGISLVRDHAYDIDLVADHVLAAAGTRFDLIVDGGPAYEVASMASLGPAVISIEGGNEVDIYPVAGATDTPSHATTEQRTLYTIVKALPAFSNAIVLNQSIGDPANYHRYTHTLAYADSANIHAYAANGEAPMQRIQDVLAIEYTDHTKPAALTETGYYTLPTDTSGVDQTVQAKYTLDTLFDTYSLGIANTYLYELLDEGADPSGTDSEMHYGLFNADGSPKLAATALHNLTQILGTAAPGTTTPIALTPAVLGLPATGNSLNLSGGNGSTFVAVWAEPEIWDQNTQQEIAATPSRVTVNLGQTVSTVSVFDPMTGTSAIAQYSDVSSVVLTVTDHPLIIQASEAAASVTTPPTTTSPTTPDPSTSGSTGRPHVYRFFDRHHGTHFYSASSAERDTVVTTLSNDLVYEGEGFGTVASPDGDPQAAPVYRFFENSFGTHFYTASATERAELIATRPDLVDEGVAFYEHLSAQPGDSPVYRLFDSTSGTHFYTDSDTERATVLATRADMRDEGIAFYAPASS